MSSVLGMGRENKTGAFTLAANRPRELKKMSTFKSGTIHAAAELGDMPALEKILKNGMLFNIKEEVMGQEAIHIAAQNGHTDMVKFMVAQSANISATDNFGVTALHVAAQANHVGVMEAIIASRSSVCDVDVNKELPLHWAATKGCIDAVKLLLKCGSPVDPRSHPACETPLMRAAYNGHKEVVEILVEAGADINARDKDGNRELHMACFTNHVPVIVLLATLTNSKSQILAPNAKGQTPYDVCLTSGGREALMVGDGKADEGAAPPNLSELTIADPAGDDTVSAMTGTALDIALTAEQEAAEEAERTSNTLSRMLEKRASMREEQTSFPDM